MITSSSKRGLEIAKDRLAIVHNLRRLAVHDSCCTHDTPAKRFADCLMTQANAEYGNASRDFLNHGERYARVGGTARSGRNHNATWAGGLNFTERYFIIPPYHHLLT